MDPTDFAPRIEQILNQMTEEEAENFLNDSRVKKLLDATKCETSHDLEHHWPFNIDREEEREDCIYCGKTKREVLAAVVNSRRQRRSGKVPPKGSFPKRGAPGIPFIKITLDDLLQTEE